MSIPPRDRTATKLKIGRFPLALQPHRSPGPACDKKSQSKIGLSGVWTVCYQPSMLPVPADRPASQSMAAPTRGRRTTLFAPLLLALVLTVIVEASDPCRCLAAETVPPDSGKPDKEPPAPRTLFEALHKYFRCLRGGPDAQPKEKDESKDQSKNAPADNKNNANGKMEKKEEGEDKKKDNGEDKKKDNGEDKKKDNGE